MKKLLPSVLIIGLLYLFFFFPFHVFAQDAGLQSPMTITTTTDLPQEGAWIKDPEVTKVGKNAARSGMLLDWTLQEYHWASTSAESVRPLAEFWTVIQRIVYSLFLFVIIVTALILIITRGKSISARRFLPRFFFVILLVTFSFSLVKFVYQITDIFQGFFLKNPQGQIISSRDLLYVGFDYKDFVGLRVFGQQYDESAMIALLLVKLTAFTYYVMSILLIVRKIILWFFIVVSPIFPLLLLFYPLRNTAKIWLGEFFRWVLYAPLFAIFLSGLVKMWQSSLPLPFNFIGENVRDNVIYPTAINILLGGPQRLVTIDNSVNLPNTFALYLVALLMLWVVIILPFILLQIFLDYMYTFTFKDSPIFKQMMGFINNRFIPPSPPPLSPTAPGQPSGLARNLPFGKRISLPQGAGIARSIPTDVATSQKANIARPFVASKVDQSKVLRMVNLSIPTMQDIARFERARLEKDTLQKKEIERTRQILRNIANPMSITTASERERFMHIREMLLKESQSGNPVALTVLQAATNYYMSNVSQQFLSQSQATEEIIQNIAHPEKITNTLERERILQLKEQIIKSSKENNPLATTLLKVISQIENSTKQQLQKTLEKISQPQLIQSTDEKEKYQELRERIVAASRSGNQLAVLLLKSLESKTSLDQVQALKEQLIKARDAGNPLASEILNIASSTTKELSNEQITTIESEIREAQKRGDPLAYLLMMMLSQKTKSKTESPTPATLKLKKGTFPVVNRIQQVSLDDYEAVKKLWKDNYQNLDIPQEVEGFRSRREWILNDIDSIQKTINLLTSQNPQDIEEGMKNVSDILPFLLIGGFSQTEIIAYLKAKMEAAKSVLEELDKETTEDLVESRPSKTSSQHQLHMSVQESIDNTSNQYENEINNSITNFYSINASIAQQSDLSTKSVNFQSAQNANSLLTLVNLPLPTMQDIVKYEKALSSKDTTSKKEVEKFLQTLKKLADPEHLTQEEKEKIQAVKDTLEKESKQGNILAESILTATKLSQEQFTEKDIPILLQLLRTITDPSMAEDPSEQETYRRLYSQLSNAKQQAQPLALEIFRLIDTLAQKESELTAVFLQKLSDPDSLTDANGRLTFLKLKERLQEESSKGNQLASFILQEAKRDTNLINANKVRLKIIESALDGDQLANFILSTHIQQIPTALQNQALTVYKILRDEKQKGNTLAQSLLRLLESKKQTTSTKIHPLLPKQNRIQQVSLEDYEAVKKLWKENFLSDEITGYSDKERAEWIKKEIANVSETINLLSSSNPEDIEQGMSRVGEILPFLLIGGFSQGEILGYLKAKLEAGKSALEEIENNQDEVVRVESNLKSKKNEKTLSFSKDFVGEMQQTAAKKTDDKKYRDKEELVSSLNLQANLPQTETLLKTLSLPFYNLKDIPSLDIQQKITPSAAFLELGALLKLAHPDKIKDAKEKEKFAQIRSALVSQARDGDEYASSILAVADIISEKADSEDIALLTLKTLQKIVFPDLCKIDEQQEMHSLNQQLQQEIQKGNLLASEGEKLAIAYKQAQLDQLANLISELYSAQAGSEDSEETLRVLRKQLENARAIGNNIAEKIIAFGEKQPSKYEIEKLLISLYEIKETDRLISTLFTSYLAPSSELLSLARAYYEKLQKQKNNPFAALLIRLIRKQLQQRKRTVASLSLPQQNRLQQVSLEDYEAVKRLWYEIYLRGDIPLDDEGETQSREQWIASDKEKLINTVNLLTSDDPVNNRRAMEQIIDILPFLLIGGFSKDEMVGYLKAKREAAEMALSVLSDQKESIFLNSQKEANSQSIAKNQNLKKDTF
ncbi:MAG: hypothetical protein KatS3mg089_0203 [Patescibacteria group bacterium]|nr:MAG: hypothetical protein KatS3mg089_0203 [Patescibacteria group bacterium]